MRNKRPPTEPFNTRLPLEIAAELRAMSARTGIPASRIIADGVRRRLTELGETWSEEPPPETGVARRTSKPRPKR